MSLPSDIQDRALASFLGLAIGDALGGTVEFMTGAEIARIHGLHRDITGGGWLHLKPGEVTDDTEMALALAEAMLTSADGWDLPCIANAFLSWMRGGPKDIGSTVRRGLRHFMHSGELCVPEDPQTAGNGALMRHLPAIFPNLRQPARMRQHCLEQAWITHRAPLADAALLNCAEITRRLLLGATPSDVLPVAEILVSDYPQFTFSPWSGRSGAFIVETLQTVYEAFFTTDNFESALLRAVNRGGDADTTGALTGQLAGAAYGLQAIPARWLRKLDPAIRQRIESAVPRLLAIQKV